MAHTTHHDTVIDIVDEGKKQILREKTQIFLNEIVEICANDPVVYALNFSSKEHKNA